MRTFWIAILVLAGAVAVIVWMSKTDDARKNAALVINNTDSTAGPAAPSNMPLNVSAGRELQPPAASPDASATSNAAALRAPNAAPVDAPGTERPVASEQTAKALADELLASSDRGESDEVADALDDGSVSTPADRRAAATAASGNAAGSIVDGKYVLGGEGTVEHPYEITWDLLVLASQTYQPRQGKTDIPPQVQAMNGKHIKIAGYYAIPIATTDPKEVLFMLNMWDGCCIGVPPSPYDAIEVRLKEAMSGQRQVANYGTLTGTLQVDPYVENNWLLGMYLMEDGTVDAGL